MTKESFDLFLAAVDSVQEIVSGEDFPAFLLILQKRKGYESVDLG